MVGRAMGNETFYGDGLMAMRETLGGNRVC